VFINNNNEFFNDLENKNYFETICEKFVENKEKFQKNFNSNDDKKNILLKINYKIAEMIKNKINKNKYYNLNIKLLNE
jgi:hypothetical protein